MTEINRNASLAVQDDVNNTAALLVLLADSPVPVGVTAWPFDLE